MIGEEKRVGIADLNVVSPPDSLITIGLGSCVGIALYDRSKKIAGLAHIMLPDSNSFKDVKAPYKFADLAIPILIKKMESMGCRKINIRAKIAGGASMFNFSDKNMVSEIGKRNAEAVKKKLKEEGIPIDGEHVGGHKGRTMSIDSNTGDVYIKIVGQDVFKL